MSIEQFSAALKNKAVREWFGTERGASASQKLENINTILNPNKPYRASEQVAEKTSFVITKDTVKDLLVSLKGMDPNADHFGNTVDTAFGEIASLKVMPKINRRVISVGPDLPGVYFDAISFDSISTLVNTVFNLNTTELAEKYHRGHVIGLNTGLLQATSDRISDIPAEGRPGAAGAKELILGRLTSIIEYYKRIDLESANIKPTGSVDIYAQASKNISTDGKTHYLVELQPRVSNQGSAEEVKETMHYVRKMFGSGGSVSNQAMSDMMDSMLKSVSDPSFAAEMATWKSSPSFQDMIMQHIVNVLSGKPKQQSYAVPNTKVATKVLPNPNTASLRAAANAERKKVEALVKKIKAPVANDQAMPAVLPLISIQAMLRQSIADTIKSNMGAGNRKDVLNLRSGRFAESVTIDRLTQSREGTISVFYNYMKYPYATFSQGGAQQSPRTRDPKTLIASSIRELGARMVSNRMRAVSL